LKLEKKIILYVQSSGIDTLGVVDREGGTFGCARAWRPLLDQKNGKYFHDRYYSDADWEALMIAEKLHENADVKIEVVDISKHVTQRIKLLLKGSITTPQFVLNGKKLPQITNVDHLTSFLQ
jgi:glutaredoxin